MIFNGLTPPALAELTRIHGLLYDEHIARGGNRLINAKDLIEYAMSESSGEHDARVAVNALTDLQAAELITILRYGSGAHWIGTDCAPFEKHVEYALKDAKNPDFRGQTLSKFQAGLLLDGLRRLTNS